MLRRFPFYSWEAGGIKVHACTNSIIRRNIFTKTVRADHLWMDMVNENNRITQNLFLDGIEQREAIFIECSRDDINLIDNNIFWNIEGRFQEEEVKEEPGSSGWYKLEESGVVNGYAVSLPDRKASGKYILHVSDIRSVKPKTFVPNDFFGNLITGESRLPGPFNSLIENWRKRLKL